MFAPVHSTTASAGPKYGASSKGYSGGSTVPARFSVHIFPKPGFGSYGNNTKMDAAGYRPSIPQPPYNPPARYDDRYTAPHPHPPAVPPPRLNTTTPSILPRPYDPKPVPVSLPAPPSGRSRPAINFSIYPGNAQDTFIYEQSQGSKSDLLSTSDFDSPSSPTESIDSTVTLRGANTPGMESSSLEPSPVEPTMSRRNSLVFNGGQEPGPSALGGDFRSRSTAPGGRPGAGPAFPPHMTAAMIRTPSESSIDVRERIAVVNAQINSASTASYYTPSPSSSVELQQPQGGPSGPPVSNSLSAQGVPSRGQQQQAVFSDTYLHSSPESLHTHAQSQPAGGRSRSASPSQLQHQPLHTDRPSPGHESRRSPPSTSQQPARPTSTYGPPSSSQMRRSPSQQPQASSSSSSPPTYPPDDYLPPATPSSSSRQRREYSPNSGYVKHAASSSPPREEQQQRHVEHQDRRRPSSGSVSPPSMSRQTSTYGSMDRVRSSNGATTEGAGHHGRYSPPEASSQRSRPLPTPVDDGYGRGRESVPRRERKQSVSYSMGDGAPVSSSSTVTPMPGPEYRERDKDRDHHSRRSGVYNPDPAGLAYQQQQSTVPFAKSSPPSPPTSSLKYSVANESLSQNYQGSYSSSSPPEKMPSRTRTLSMSNGASRPDLSMSSVHISADREREDAVPMSRGPRHPDLTPPSHGPVPTPGMSTPAPAAPGFLEPDANANAGAGTYRRRRMSIISQMSDAGSMATTTTATTATTMGAAPGVSYSDHHVQRGSELPPLQTPHRRMSDGDRPVASVRYDLKTSQQQQQTYLPHLEPQRRYSDGDQNQPHPSFKQQQQHSQYYQKRQQEQQAAAAAAAVAARNVRWNDNLICPSPVLPSQKRKGWYNRRGDQLWTNDGLFRPAPVDQQYPADLDDYPEHGEGWMNEDGVRIDLEHRRVPKVPRRSALKPVFQAGGGRN